MTTERDRAFLRRAARLARRGHGHAEPNPTVGCVIVDDDGTIVGDGFHRRCGGPHAEIEALAAAGPRSRGATVYVTLEPCGHTGRTGPCSEALIDAGVRRVVFAREDPHPSARGGAARLRAAGIEVACVPCPEARAVSDPFVHHLRTGRPWVIAKWAQTIDGRVATRTGESQWISGDRSRRLVHRQRGRVDAILTGIGTVRTDDPMLTARCRRPRRTALRVVVDPRLGLPRTAKLVATAAEVPTIVFTCEDVDRSLPDPVTVERVAGAVGAELPVEPVLRTLANRYDVRTVLVEAGPGLLGRLFAGGLVNEAWVFVAPLLLGDEHAVPAVRGATAPRLSDGVAMELVGRHVRGDDVLLRYRRP